MPQQFRRSIAILIFVLIVGAAALVGVLVPTPTKGWDKEKCQTLVSELETAIPIDRCSIGSPDCEGFVRIGVNPCQFFVRRNSTAWSKAQELEENHCWAHGNCSIPAIR